MAGQKETTPPPATRRRRPQWLLLRHTDCEVDRAGIPKRPHRLAKSFTMRVAALRTESGGALASRNIGSLDNRADQERTEP
jgi:hypothetical protein